MLKKYCFREASLPALTNIIQATRPYMKRERSFFTSWRKHLSQSCPTWPFANFLATVDPSIRAHMATVSTWITNKSNVMVMPSPIEIGKTGLWHTVKDMTIVADEKAAVIAPRVSLDERVRLLSAPDSSFYLNQSTYKYPTPSSYGRYRLDQGNNVLQVITKGDIGIYVLELRTDVGNLMMAQATTLCDSLWSNDDCTDWKTGLPADSDTNLIVFMGPKYLKDDSRLKRDAIRGALQMTDLETFDQTIRGWLFNSNPKKRFFLLASWIFHH